MLILLFVAINLLAVGKVVFVLFIPPSIRMCMQDNGSL
jgi:hypothetical protein